MPSRGEIKSEKILVKDIFSNMWFRIPEYQRPYVWGADEIGELLDDLKFALTEKPDFEYFLGSFVFQSKVAQPEKGQEFNENDLLDGQQRMTTLLLLFAVIRDLASDPDAKDDFRGASTKRQANTRRYLNGRDSCLAFEKRFKYSSSHLSKMREGQNLVTNLQN